MLSYLTTMLASNHALPVTPVPLKRVPQIVGLVQATGHSAAESTHHWHPIECTAAGVTCAE